jgi:dTDP-4-amino-4,6-dideoxygalactose transaminase
MWKVQLFKLNYDEAESAAVNAVLDSQWLTMGDKTAEFERQFATMLGNEVSCISVANCTAALHLAMLALGLERGDEVVIPALTFIAAANTVVMAGGTPVLADVSSLSDWNVSVDSIDRCVTDKTRAVVIVHFAGHPCDMAAISEYCKLKGLFLVEDCAHAPGAISGDAACGTWGDVGCFSFFSNKNLSVGEGGMLAAKNPDLLTRLGHLRSHGMTSLTLDRHKGRASTYDVVSAGLNYRMDELRSALGIAQLQKLSGANEQRGRLTEIYRRLLIPFGVDIPFGEPFLGKSSYHILPTLLPQKTSRDQVMQAMKEKGIQTSIHYPPTWRMTGYKSLLTTAEVPIADVVCDRELTLPLYPTLTEAEVQFVADSLIECM